MTVVSSQIDTLRDQLGILEAGLRKRKSDCLESLKTEGYPAQFVTPMIEEAESKPQKNPRLQLIYRHCQRIAEKKEEMAEAE